MKYITVEGILQSVIRKHAMKLNYGMKRVYLMSSVKSNISRDAAALLAKFHTTGVSGTKER